MQARALLPSGLDKTRRGAKNVRSRQRSCAGLWHYCLCSVSAGGGSKERRDCLSLCCVLGGLCLFLYICYLLSQALVHCSYCYSYRHPISTPGTEEINVQTAVRTDFAAATGMLASASLCYFIQTAASGRQIFFLAFNALDIRWQLPLNRWPYDITERWQWRAWAGAELCCSHFPRTVISSCCGAALRAAQITLSATVVLCHGSVAAVRTGLFVLNNSGVACGRGCVIMRMVACLLRRAATILSIVSERSISPS